jgi:proline dehydrogenase
MLPLDFNNTEIAFAGLSDGQLRQALCLFQMFSLQSVVNYGPALASIGLKARLPIKGLIKKTFYRQFCGGESIEDCHQTIERLARRKVGTILDFASEGVASAEQFAKTVAETNANLDYAARKRFVPFCVFKPTGIACLDLMARASEGTALSNEDEKEIKNARQRIQELCHKAFTVKVPLMIDAEETWIQPFIDQEYLAMARTYNKEKPYIFNTVQMYRHDRLDYLKDLAKIAQKENFKVGIKLVRGAYWDKETARATELGLPSPLFATKPETDAAYDAAVTFITDHLDIFSICAGTHNEFSTNLLASRMRARTMPLGEAQCSFAQLLGMSDHLTYNLAHAGFLTAKYVPYGPVADVIPYLGRRAQENSSVKGQTSREVLLVKKELNRRASLSKSSAKSQTA